MADDLQVHPVGLTGGLQDSKAIAEPGDFERIFNFVTYRGRISLRAPVTNVATLKDDQTTPVEVTSVLDLVSHEDKIYAVTYSSNTNKVYLHSMDLDGTNATREAVVWTSVTSAPTVTTASFSGGSASSPTTRLYIADYDQNENTKFWDGTTMTTVQEDLNNDSTDENVSFSIVESFQFHLWGSGFFEGGASARPEMFRFSEPGLIPVTDPAGGNNPKEWRAASHRSFGRRGTKITATAKAKGNMIVFKRNSTHALFGYGADSWATKEVSEFTGCIGPHAATSADGQWAYFWSADGPFRTDGTNLQNLGEPIRQHIVEVESTEDIQAQYSPDDGIVYFIVRPSGTGKPTRYFAFDTDRERWTHGEWLGTGGSAIPVGASEVVPSEVLLGPDGAPGNPKAENTTESKDNTDEEGDDDEDAESEVDEGDTFGDASATALSHQAIKVTWDNGDVSFEGTTHVYRSTSSGFSPSDSSNKVGEVKSGGTSFIDTGLSAETEYFYKLRHFVQQSHSSATSEVSATTALEPPTNVRTIQISNGLKVKLDNNASGADIAIERRVEGESDWIPLTTLSTPGTGAVTHDDTTATCGTRYTYRARAEKTGETSSQWKSSDPVAACGTAPSLSSATVTLVDRRPGKTVKVTWSGSDYTVDDQVRILEDRNSTGFSELTWLKASDEVFLYPWDGALDGSASLQIKVELYDGGTDLVTSATTGTVNP